MLNTETKRRIDAARDILVGKVPDPKSQIEQITLALIYKFMDDMDREAVEKFKGKAKFFTGEWAKYSWRNIFDPKIGGHELIKLYGEALENMNTNPGIPDLFKDIFKNAYLPYRNPETLKLFLKTINEFSYGHSEELGNAYEYLLSVLGTQGDAGQFRTPRHIIEFIVACLDPQKQETICDPACGTAGFLLSAYKHILRNNGKDNPGDKLTPDERKMLADNLTGYDIDPNMERFALVNMFLHGFVTPRILEYDTLTSEDRWLDYFDVIMANPPFMTPKGGIRPHRRFSIQANKSEVLFTDYIAEHLNPNGRAGVIVPNGIIATTQTAYKGLRKMLVESYLVAVVSLPAGVFNPYSGVKTSILLMDKKLSKKTDEILFLKVENDGYDLGAQRREIEKNDLTVALRLFSEFKQATQNGISFKLEENSIGFLVDKKKILENRDVNLSGDRYTTTDILSYKYDFEKLGNVCKVINGKAYKQEELLDKGKYRVLRVGNFFTNNSWYYSDLELPEDKYCDNGDLLYAWSASFGPKIWRGEKVIYHYHIWKMIPDESKILKDFLYLILFAETKNMKAEGGRGSTMIHLTKEGIEEREIPTPPLSVQHEIVAEIEGYQKIIDGARKVVENYKPQIKIKPEWEMVELGELSTLISSGATPKGGKEVYQESGVLFIRSQNILWGETDFSDAVFITNETYQKMKRSQVKIYDVFLNITGASIGRSAVMKENIEANVNQHVVIIRTIKEKLNPLFLSTLINSPYIQNTIFKEQTGAARLAINYQQIKEFKIPLPTIEEQLSIVKAITEEIQIIEANKKLILLYEQKIKVRIAEVWGKDSLKP